MKALRRAGMKRRLVQSSKLIAVFVFMAGVSFYIRTTMAGKTPTAKPFVITYKVSNVEGNSQPVEKEIRVQLVKPTGEQMLTIYYLASGRIAKYVTTLDSVYEVKPDCLQYFGQSGSAELREQFRSAAFLKAHPNFVREEEVCGLRTYVLHTQEDGDRWIEGYSATETANVPIKTVLHHGSGSCTIIEAISVQFRDSIDADVILPSLPVRFDKAEGRVKEYADSGALGTADALKEDLDKEKRKSSGR
jgi:hypothetical protein